ncbi:hypothetical protein [Caulobacter endophyticus]|uniref:hypothetical protein n=1 Tax=Caulobacter endophyticus TaxID=2172652 RepID=UPI00240FAC62|nr:hypothetical protein [Caulobacter endophyticus]MDG2528121.1 hypothetical protein [Caulobacter endophyticus]
MISNAARRGEKLSNVIASKPAVRTRHALQAQADRVLKAASHAGSRRFRVLSTIAYAPDLRSTQRLGAVLAAPVPVCHDYLPQGRTDYRWETTVAEQRGGDTDVRDGQAKDRRVAPRKTRDPTPWPRPHNPYLHALQVSIRAGALPAASAEGAFSPGLPARFAP